MTSRSLLVTGECLNHQPLIRRTPDSCTARWIARASSSVIASGFSQKMCLPASHALTTSSAWVSWVAQINTASTLVSPRTRSRSVV